MKKLLLILLCLPLLFSTCKKEEDGQTSNTNSTSIIGTWSGQLTQIGFGDYPVEMIINNLVVGENSGNTNYASIPCSGELTLLSNTDSLHVFSEMISSGLCDSGEIELYKLSEDSIQFNWYYPNSTNLESNGILTRVTTGN